MRDLDIRGAGDLLGADQSGFINEIGFEMYQRILNEAVEELREEKFKNLFKDEKEKFKIKDCQLDTDKEILIPESYVESVEERINLYQKLNQINNDDELNLFQTNLIDRFGKMPNKINDLFNAIKLKWIGKELGFEKISLKKNIFRGFFTSNQNSKYFESNYFRNILNFLRENPQQCELKEVKNKLVLKHNYIQNINDVLKFLFQIKNHSE